MVQCKYTFSSICIKNALKWTAFFYGNHHILLGDLKALQRSSKKYAIVFYILHTWGKYYIGIICMVSEFYLTFCEKINIFKIFFAFSYLSYLNNYIPLSLFCRKGKNKGKENTLFRFSATPLTDILRCHLVRNVFPSKNSLWSLSLCRLLLFFSRKALCKFRLLSR